MKERKMKEDGDNLIQSQSMHIRQTVRWTDGQTEGENQSCHRIQTKGRQNLRPHVHESETYINILANRQTYQKTEVQIDIIIKDRI